MKRQSLRIKLNVLVALFILTTIVVLGIILAWGYAYDEQKRLVRSLSKELEIVSYAASAGLEFNDTKTVEEALALLKNVTEFNDVKVLDHNGKIFMHKIFQRTGKDATSDTFVVETMIFNAVNVRIGKIEAVATARYFKEDVKRSLGMVLIVTLFVTLLALSLVAIFLGRFFMPLAQLKNAIDRVAGQGFIGRVDVVSDDEVGDLAKSFNEMSGALEKTTVSRDALFSEIELRRKMEGVLREREMTISAISDSTQDAILMMDADEKISFWNPAAEHIFGWTKEEAFGQQFHFFITPEYYKKTSKNSFSSFLATGRSGAAGKILELRGVRKDKTEFPFEMSLSMLELEGRRHAAGIIRDITEAKKREEELQTAVGEAEKSREIMASMLADNSKIREELEKSLEGLKEAHALLAHAEKMEAVGRMASGVAHEVKNPLGIILQGINYLEDVLPVEKRDDRKMLLMMKDSVKRADRIVRGLLDFSRTQEPNAEPQDINVIIGDSLELVQHRFKMDVVEPVCELGKGLPKTLLDIGKIEQMFVNLFNNAVDAMPNGGKLFVRSYLSRLEEPGNRVGSGEDDFFRVGEKGLFVEVEDTGTGIGEDIIKKIFDPFFTTKNRSEGTGLGLSIAKSLVEMHRGLIRVKSEKGKGSKFTIVFKIPREGEKL